ncbi:MAG: glycosyltransferase family 1 protein [Vulcanimicrobiaceae bacterium]
MKIAMVSEHASPLATIGSVDAGGQNVHVAELGAALVTDGNDVHVYTRRDSEHLPEVVALPSGVVVHHIDAGPAKFVEKDALLPHMDAFAAALAREFACEAFDVAHAHFWMSGRATIAAARDIALPVVHTYHALGVEKRRQQADADTSPPERIATELAILRAADRIVATSSSEVFELMRMGAEAPKLKIVPCGVDLAFFDRAHDRAPRPRRQRYRIATLSRLVRRKGVGDVIRALQHLPETELLIGGGSNDPSDPDACELRAIAADCGVTDRVVFHGRVDRSDVPAFLRSADVVVCAAWYEPFGIVPLEAMAVRVPVVATAVGGQNDTVLDGYTGYSALPHEPRTIVGAVRALLADATLRARFGAAGRRRVEERYAWTRIARETERVYRGILRTPSRMDATA